MSVLKAFFNLIQISLKRPISSCAEPLERIAENQKKEGERLEEQRVSQNQRDDDFIDKKRAFQNEKAEFEQEKEGATQKAVEQYDEYMKSEKFQNADFPQLPTPESKEEIQKLKDEH